MKANLNLISKRSEYGWTLIAVINMAGFLGFAKVSEIPPIIPLLSQDLKVSYESLSLLMTAYSVTRLIGSFGVGWLSDRWGPNWVITLGMLLLGVFGLLPTLTSNFGLMVVFRVLLVLGVSGIMVAGMDAMTKIMPGSKMSLGIGLFDASVSLGSAGAYLLVPIMSAWYGWRWTLRVSSFASLALVIPLLFTLKRPHVSKLESPGTPSTVEYQKSTFR